MPSKPFFSGFCVGEGQRERDRESKLIPELMPLQCFELCYVACDIVGSVCFKTNDTLTGHLLFVFLSLSLFPFFFVNSLIGIYTFCCSLL